MKLSRAICFPSKFLYLASNCVLSNCMKKEWILVKWKTLLSFIKIYNPTISNCRNHWEWLVEFSFRKDLQIIWHRLIHIRLVCNWEVLEVNKCNNFSPILLYKFWPISLRLAKWKWCVPMLSAATCWLKQKTTTLLQGNNPCCRYHRMIITFSLSFYSHSIIFRLQTIGLTRLLHVNLGYVLKSISL